jgi:hypothetical protein
MKIKPIIQREVCPGISSGAYCFIPGAGSIEFQKSELFSCCLVIYTVCNMIYWIWSICPAFAFLDLYSKTSDFIIASKS